VLTAALGGPRLFIKRDDLTGLALGGNKARKLEFLLGAARAAGATAVLTTAGVNSNYLRMTAAGARKAGLRPILFMRGTGQEPIQGNLLLDEIVGAELRFIRPDTDPWSPEGRLLMEDAARELEERGERPYIITVQTTHAPLAAVGYANAVLELHQQLLERGVHADFVFTPASSGVTQAGLLVGARLMNWNLTVVGVAVSPGNAEAHRQRVADIAGRAAALLGASSRFDPADVVVDDSYAGVAYSVPTPEVVSAIRRVGELEGLILDPVYSGKNMYALFDWINQGRLTSDHTVVFLHTGGAPNLFTQADTLGPALRRLGIPAQRAEPVAR
jgi:1-aminocyclopropane-1-carboxylate deaminase/D-cysteine desulfhydrase-like pyridoxal-dependent ACC family enzyme